MDITLGVVSDMGAIIKATGQGQKVAWIIEGGHVVEGTLRHITRDINGNFAFDSADPTEVFVRITTTVGVEVFLPLLDVAARYRAGTFVLDYAG